MREGARYLENQWEKLRIPFEIDGRLEIDNGAAERRLRRLAAGRRSWLFAGSTSGAERIAQMLSLVSTAGVNPGAYLTDVFSKIPTAGRTAASMSSCPTAGPRRPERQLPLHIPTFYLAHLVGTGAAAGTLHALSSHARARNEA